MDHFDFIFEPNFMIHQDFHNNLYYLLFLLLAKIGEPLLPKDDSILFLSAEYPDRQPGRNHHRLNYQAQFLLILWFDFILYFHSKLIEVLSL